MQINLFNKKNDNKIKYIAENIVFGVDIGSKSLKVSTLELTDSNNYLIHDMSEEPFSSPLNYKNFDEQIIKTAFLTIFEKLKQKGLFEIAIKKALVILPMGTYLSKVIHKETLIKDSIVKYENKINLINKAKEECNKNIILHTIPMKYFVDGNEVKDPIGLQGEVLAMDVFIIGYEELIFEKIKSILKELEIQVGKYIAPPLSFINFYLTNIKYKEYNPLILDFGGECSYLYNICNGLLKNFYSINLGGEIITRDVSQVLGIETETAQKLKDQYIDLTDHTIQEEINLNGIQVDMKLFREVVISRYEEIIEKLENNSNFEKMKKDSNALILLGNGHLIGAEVYLKNRWGLPILTEIENFKEKHFLCANGAINYAINNDIYLYHHQNKKNGFFHELIRVVEDLF